MYDDSSGLITGNAEQSSNHNLTFDEHSNILANTIAGSSSISLLPRQNQGEFCLSLFFKFKLD